MAGKIKADLDRGLTVKKALQRYKINNHVFLQYRAAYSTKIIGYQIEVLS